ncbi:NTP transferase domain-containing protein [Ammonicoccus fulvus]|uniref:NTP transferase domain-containing protein n=1 Tax=Ammonicoccus fulvus TaxID=3138240 RepID=A0ABZ3FNF9_9ACTN
MANLTCAVIVLAGGRSRRLNGVTKGLLLAGGRTLLEHGLFAAADACHRVVAGLPELPVPDGVSLVREDPPFGGPVAGIAAGMDELARLGCRAEWVFVLACDHPYAESAAEALFAMVEERPSRRPQAASSGTGTSVSKPPTVEERGTSVSKPPLDHLDLITPTDSTGHRQTLFALYRRTALVDALARVGGGHNCSAKRLVADLRTWSPVLPDGLLIDIDDPAAAAAAGIALPHPEVLPQP